MSKKITLHHGNGTKDTHDLIQNIFVRRFNNPYLRELSDAANVDGFVFSCDSFTVTPIRFPSSDIGQLAVFGTVNDICVSAAVPLYISCAVVVEEGFPYLELEHIARSMQKAACQAKVQIVTGDFKVVERKKIDKIFITTSGIGRRIPRRHPSPRNIRDKDALIITGTIAQHGAAVLLSRNKIFDFAIKSDCASIDKHVLGLWRKFPSIRCMRDPTRGGLASTLNEIALHAELGIRLKEDVIPITKEVSAACELLGIDPYYLASEGRALIVCAQKDAKRIVRFLHTHGAKDAACIGTFSRSIQGVLLETVVGGERLLDFTYSFTLPRIC